MTHIHVGERQASSPATDFSAIYHKEWMHYKGWFAKSTDSVSLEISWFSMRHWKCRRVNACPCQPEKTADISRRHHWFLHVRWRLRNWVVILIGRTAREVFFSQSEALPDLSSVWNLCNCFSDVISRGNQWCCPEMSKGHACYLLAWLKLSQLDSWHG